MDKMRVALVSPYSWTYPGGVTRHIEALAESFSEAGHHVRVLAPYDPPDTLSAALHRGAGPQPLDAPDYLVSLGRTVGFKANGAVSNLSITPYGVATLHPESVVIGAGNRSQDSAIVRPMSSALINRMVHVHLVSSARDWLAWARRSGIHPWVIDYISQRPDHLTTAPPRHEEPFSTPRAWHILSDLLHSYGAGLADGPEMPDELLRILALGTVSPSHAGQFRPHIPCSSDWT